MMCELCGDFPAAYITRENKKSQAIFLCSKCSLNKEYQRWGIVSYHKFLEERSIRAPKIQPSKTTNIKTTKKPRKTRRKKKNV